MKLSIKNLCSKKGFTLQVIEHDFLVLKLIKYRILRLLRESGVTRFLNLVGSSSPSLPPSLKLKRIKSDEIGNTIEVDDLVRQINFEVDSDDVQELQNFHNQELRQLKRAPRSARAKNKTLESL
ncbi:hypothetical protein TNCV_3417111 [Trichonephila clavipes]|nr:hypothetical protein TNCV_3417111 [Trichonephila clavipes]